MQQIIASLVISLESTRERLIAHRAELAQQHQMVVDVLGYDPSRMDRRLAE